MLIAFYSIVSLAIAVMLVALVMVIKLRKLTKSGKVGRVVSLLFGFILFFLCGYLVAPLMVQLDCAYMQLLTGLVFLFGAVFVVIVLGLLSRLVKQIFEELQL